MSYSVAKQKIKQVKEEVEDGQNTAERVGDAMLYALDYSKEELDTKSTFIEISGLMRTGTVLPLNGSYVYQGKPTHSISGVYDEDNKAFIAICYHHDSEDEGHNVAIFIKNGSDYVFTGAFNTNNTESAFENYIVEAFGGSVVNYDHNGLMASADKRLFDQVVREVFPVEAKVVSSNAGIFEVGTSVTPSVTLAITRNGEDVAASASVAVTPSTALVSSDNKTVTDSARTSGAYVMQIKVTQAEQDAVVDPNPSWTWSNYRYRGTSATKPTAANIADAIKALATKELSTTSTLGSTNLAANMYYIFAVKGNVTLVAHHAGTDAKLTGCTTGKVTIERVNKSGSDEYSYIIVEKSSSAWSFTIKNS